MSEKVYCNECKHLDRTPITHAHVIRMPKHGLECFKNAKGSALSKYGGRYPIKVKNANNDCADFEAKQTKKKSFLVRMFSCCG